jgi:hypothetical protein
MLSEDMGLQKCDARSSSSPLQASITDELRLRQGAGAVSDGAFFRRDGRSDIVLAGNKDGLCVRRGPCQAVHSEDRSPSRAAAQLPDEAIQVRIGWRNPGQIRPAIRMVHFVKVGCRGRREGAAACAQLQSRRSFGETHEASTKARAAPAALVAAGAATVNSCYRRYDSWASRSNCRPARERSHIGFWRPRGY